MGSTTKHLPRNREIAKRFLQTAVVVDDEAYMSPDRGDTPTEEVVTPGRRQQTQSRPDKISAG